MVLAVFDTLVAPVVLEALVVLVISVALVVLEMLVALVVLKRWVSAPPTTTIAGVLALVSLVAPTTLTVAF